ncbi:MAG: hypothetical protein NXI24_02060 [bacterium]|nr:hypothetical protein [bacterium]
MTRSESHSRRVASHARLCFALGLALIAFGNCATILKGEAEGLVLSTPEPAPRAADYYVTVRRSDTDAVVAEGPAPLQVRLKTGAGYFAGARYRVVAEDPEGLLPPRELFVETRWSWPLHLFSNLVLGGFLGWFVVDPYTGAMWEFDTEDGLIEIVPAPSE